MLKSIPIGQYVPGSSPLHRLDPRMKLGLIFAYIILIFFIKNFYGLLLAGCFLLFAVLLSRLPVGLVLRSVRPVLVLVAFTSIVNILYVKGDVLWHWGILTVTKQGLISAAFIGVRILFLIMGSSLLTFTTTPTALTDGIERLLRPLKVLHVPVHELAMMMTIALRFIPTLIEDTDRLISAQKARGADMDSGGPIKRIKAFVPILVPLFVSAFRRAYELSVAMECRCYHGGAGRTRMKQAHMRLVDGMGLLLFAAVVVGIVVLNIFVARVI
ncbi:MAG: energy-coupling factor transporter transmembrane protein EcfT [Oscillospiraceae bacterium]|nr:energy-coupling factor transporter transmembrane protein EcfT [Oscillospiraceae bacterium]